MVLTNLLCLEVGIRMSRRGQTDVWLILVSMVSYLVKISRMWWSASCPFWSSISLLSHPYHYSVPVILNCNRKVSKDVNICLWEWLKSYFWFTNPLASTREDKQIDYVVVWMNHAGPWKNLLLQHFHGPIWSFCSPTNVYSIGLVRQTH